MQFFNMIVVCQHSQIIDFKLSWIYDYVGGSYWLEIVSTVILWQPFPPPSNCGRFTGNADILSLPDDNLIMATSAIKSIVSSIIYGTCVVSLFLYYIVLIMVVRLISFPFRFLISCIGGIIHHWRNMFYLECF